jgi:hypothetical protein
MSLSWAREPLYARLFFIYLVLVLGLSFLLTINVLRVLYSRKAGTRGKRLSVHDVRSGAIDAEQVVRSLLRNNITGNDFNETDPFSERAVQVLSRANVQVSYVLAKLQMDVVLIRRLAGISLLICYLIFAYSVYPAWLAEFENANVPGAVALMRAGFIIFDRLAIGLSACVLLYGMVIVLERMLLRRKAMWHYVYSHS